MTFESIIYEKIDNNIAKITDFGTSAWLSRISHASTRIGSPPYMAPEQFAGKSTFVSSLLSGTA